MAQKQMLDPSFTIDGANTYKLGSIGRGNWGVMTIHLQGVLWNGTIVVKARADARSDGATDTFVAIPYKKLFLNGAVGDGTNVSTSITGDSLIQIDNAAGLEVALDCTTYTGGKMLVEVRRTSAD